MLLIVWTLNDLVKTKKDKDTNETIYYTRPWSDEMFANAQALFTAAVSRFPIVCLLGPGRADWWKIQGDFDEHARRLWEMARNFGIVTINGVDFFEKCERRDDWHPKTHQETVHT